MKNQTSHSIVENKVHLISLGCARNRVDSELMLGGLLGEGWCFEAEPSASDVIIINTCGFIASAKDESVETILECLEYKQANPNLKLVVAGCLTQRYKSQLAKGLPEVDLFVGTDEFVKIPEYLKDLPNKGSIKAKRTNYIYDAYHPRVNTLSKHSVYVKVAEGCQHNCAFCIIPAIRGRLRSRPVTSVVEEVKNFVKQGVVEINLIAQDLAAYGRDREDQANLLGLLRELVRIEGLAWIRLLYMYPENISDEFVEFFAKEDKIVKYLDIPVQHASNAILKSMNRDTTKEEIREVVSKLRAKIPHIAIRTSVMVGFPGESEADFTQLCEFVKEMKFSHLGCFKYSKEEGTAAGRMPDQVDENIMDERFHKIMSIQQEISKEALKAKCGKVVDVLIEEAFENTEGSLRSRLSTQAPEVDGVVYIKTKENLKAGFHKVKITGSSEYDLLAQPV